MVPPFYRGQNGRNFGHNFDYSRLRTAIFLNCGALSENKKNLSRTDDRSTTIPNLGWVGPPTPRTVGAMGTPKGKVEIFLYILSSGPRRLQRHQRYTTCCGRSCCKKTTVPYLSIHPYISQVAKISSPTSPNLGPRHILETVRAKS